MRIETVRYVPSRPPFILADIIKMLPEKIVGELRNSGREIYVTVDANKFETVAFLDDYFSISQSDQFYKRTDLEIDKKDIDDFDYFLISPQVLQLGCGINADITRPSCDFEPCPIGSHIIKPVTVTQAKCRTLGIAGIGRAWGGFVSEMLVSAMTKKLFDENGITGLTYEPCILQKESKKTGGDLEVPFFAEIDHWATDEAIAMRLDESCYCQKHSIIFTYRLKGRQVKRCQLANKDIVGIKGLSVEGKEYLYRQYHILISRRTLQLLLRYKIPGLMAIGFYLGQRFLPVILAGAEQSRLDY